MQFSAIRFVEGKMIEISGLPQSGRYVLSAREGFILTLDPSGAGVIATHPIRLEPLWIPVANIASADVILETEAATEEAPKRGPGRPAKVA